MEQKFCQSCGMPLTEDVLGTNADGSKNEDYCMYCYRDGQFLQDCTMEEMIEHCAQFVNAVNEGLEKPITKVEYIGMMKTYFPQLKRDGRQTAHRLHLVSRPRRFSLDQGHAEAT